MFYGADWGCTAWRGSEGLDHPPALLSALAFEAMPKLFAHSGAGHLTLLYALSWTPWLLLAGATYPRSSGRSSGWLVVLGRASFGADLPGGRPLESLRRAAMVGICSVCMSKRRRIQWLLGSIVSYRCAHDPDSASCVAGGSPGLAAAGVYSPFHSPLDERAGCAGFFAVLPRLLGLVFPDFNGFHEYMAYAGQAALLLALLALVWVASKRAVRFWLAVWRFRSPSPWALTCHRYGLQPVCRSSTCCVSLPGLFSLAGFPSPSWRLTPSSSSLLLIQARSQSGGLAAHRLCRLSGCAVPRDLVHRRELPVNFAWGAGFALLSAVWIGLKLSGRIPDRLWIVGLLIICLIDWGALDRTLFWPRSTQQVLSEGEPLAEYLQYSARHEAGFRLYSPSYSMPQQTAARYRLQLADGVDPLQLQSYVELMQLATGVPGTAIA